MEKRERGEQRQVQTAGDNRAWRRNARNTATAPVLVTPAWVRAASIERMAPSEALCEATTRPAS